MFSNKTIFIYLKGGGLNNSPLPKKEFTLISNKRFSAGFTLIELLVVIAIIGLLATISVVSVRKAIERAKITKVIYNLGQMANAINLYYLDTGTVPPWDTGWATPTYYCEPVAFGNGNFTPKPTGWNGPYMAWPENPWGGRYMSLPYILIDGIPLSAQQMIDDIADDGNLNTGLVISFGGGIQLLYLKDLMDLPSPGAFYASCTP